MPVVNTDVPYVTLTLSEQERMELLRLLEQALKEKRVEVHRTDSLDYQSYVQHQEDVLQSLVDKLRRS